MRTAVIRTWIVHDPCVLHDGSETIVPLTIVLGEPEAGLIDGRYDR